jgi:hypothetical protein
LRRYQGESARGQRAGLVEHHGVDLGQAFEGVAGFDQHTLGEQDARSDHLNHWNGETERTRARDDQQGDRMQERDLGGSTLPQPPAGERRQRKQMHGGRVDPRGAVRDAHEARAPLLGVFDQPDDFRGQRGVAAGAAGAGRGVIRRPGPMAG